MSEQDSIRELGEYDRVLWEVLAALSRSGYAVPPSDARDLMHDFYLDAWAGIKERFDPKLGLFAGYVASAFYRFARRRILKMEGIAQRTVDFDAAVAEISSGSTPPEILESRERHQAVSAALHALTPLEQRVLEDYLSGDDSSERQLAQRHRLTRYGVREVLADSVGKVAMTLGKKLSSATKAQQNIVELLWKYGQSARDVATYLDIPVAEVQAARHQVVSALLAEIRDPHRQFKAGRLNMKHDEALKVLKSAVSSIGDPKLLDAVRTNRAGIQKALNEGVVLLDDAQWARLEENPEWLAKIYDCLAETSEETEESEVSRAIAALRGKEDQEIGEAFAALIKELPSDFHDWPQLFRNIDTVDRKFQRELINHRSVPHSDESFGLTAYGMTPVTFFSAARGLEMLFQRTERAARAGVRAGRAAEGPRKFKLPKAVTLDFGAERGCLPISDDLMIAEVASTPGLAPGAEEPITQWILGALHFKPYIIDGYCASVERDRITLRWQGVASQNTQKRKDLIGRWTQGRGDYRRAAAALAG